MACEDDVPRSRFMPFFSTINATLLLLPYDVSKYFSINLL